MNISSNIADVQYGSVQKPKQITASEAKTMSKLQARKAAEDVEAFSSLRFLRQCSPVLKQMALSEEVTGRKYFVPC